ncbi:unnamed protein product [Choristocarpus tenellus]
MGGAGQLLLTCSISLTLAVTGSGFSCSPHPRRDTSSAFICSPYPSRCSTSPARLGICRATALGRPSERSERSSQLPKRSQVPVRDFNSLGIRNQSLERPQPEEATVVTIPGLLEEGVGIDGVAVEEKGVPAGDVGRFVEKETLFVGDAERAVTVANTMEESEDNGVLISTNNLSRRWRGRITSVIRTFQIWLFLFHVLFKLLRQKLVQRDEERMSQRRRKLGKYLCRAFLKLGPTFIKIGQLLSTRVDLLATEYIEELRRLQDDVPGFGGEKAVEIIERELGAPVDELFDSFNRTSLAAASLGQVHEAYLNGSRYAVKVQRPGLRELFRVDLRSIGLVAALLDRFDPKLDGASRDWGAIFRESSRVLYEEVDYMREGSNAERFSQNFKNCQWVKAPIINWDRSTDKVLCMEFLEGIKISEVDKIEAANIDRELLAKRTAECYLAQLCRHGFFHCDPHPGNLACDGVDGGRIIFYDFGMMDELSLPLKRGLVNLIFGIYGNDVIEVCDSLEEMDIIRKGTDRITVERVTRFYLGEFQHTLKSGGKYINQLDSEEERKLARRERAQIGQDLFSGSASVPVQFPACFTFVFRAFTTLDGIGKTLDPRYDLTKIASPYLKELLDLKDGNTYVSVFKTWAKRLGWRGQDIASVVQSPRRVQHVDSVVTKLERGDLKLRVRVLESEAAFARMEALQGSLSAAMIATLFLNVGVLLTSRAVPSIMAARAMFALSGLFGIQVPFGYFRIWQMKQQEQNARGFR